MNLMDYFRRRCVQRRFGGAAAQVVLAALVLGLSAGASIAAPTVSVDPSYAEVQEDGTVWLNIALNDEVTGVTGYHFVIDFDETVLEVADVEEGELPAGYAGQTFMNWTDDGTASSALDVTGAMLGGSVDGPGVLVRVQFTAIDRGSSPIELTLVDLRDIDNQPIAVSASDGEVQVVPIGHVYFDPSHSEVSEFDHFWVDVCFDSEVTNVTGYQFVIDFDEDLLTVLGVEEGDLPSGYSGESFCDWRIDGTTTRALVVDGAVLGGSIDGPGSVVRIEFEALAAGVSELSFTSVELRDIDNVSLESIEEDGDVEIGSVGRIYIDPSYETVLKDSTVCVDVAIDGLVEGLTGFHLLVDFDENLLEVVSVERTGLTEDHADSTSLFWYASGQPSNALLIDGAFLGFSVDGPGSLVSLCFVGLAGGITQLEFTLVELRDLDNNEIVVGTIPGTIEVEAPPVNVEPTTWGAIKAMYLE